MPAIPVFLSVLALLALTAPASAEADSVAETRARLAQLLASPAAQQNEAFRRDARERAAFCSRCHGEDGNSVMPLVPNLAGQNAYYLLEQIERFANGQRTDFIMSPLARQLTPEDRATVAAYYAMQRPRPYAADPQVTRRGQVRFRQSCVGCHGSDARGGEQFARLASQHPEYLRHRLYQFQNRKAEEGKGAVMSDIARTLSDEDIAAIAAYLAALP